jgi:hypothetical protein
LVSAIYVRSINWTEVLGLASITVSATPDEHLSSQMLFFLGAEALCPHTEAAGVANTMIEAEMRMGIYHRGSAGVLVKRQHLALPSFGALQTFGASYVPGPLPIAELPLCPEAQSLAFDMCQSIPHS